MKGVVSRTLWMIICIILGLAIGAIIIGVWIKPSLTNFWLTIESLFSWHGGG